MLNITNDTRCPECGSNSARRSQRRRIEKVLLSILFCFPCRCMECFCRYYVFKNPFHSIWLKLFAGITTLGLIAVIGVISTRPFYASNLEDLATWLSKQAPPLLPQLGSNLATTLKTRQETAAGAVIPESDMVREERRISDPMANIVERAAPETVVPESDIASEEPQIPVPRTRVVEIAPEAQNADIVQPGRKMITLKVNTGRVRENHSTDAKIKFLLNKHDTVLILNSIDSWYFVRLGDGKQGWIHQSLF